MMNMTDDGLLKANGIFHGAWALNSATPSNPVFKKAIPDSQMALGVSGTHCLAVSCAAIGARDFMLGNNKDALAKTKKDALKVAGVTNLGWAGFCAYHASKGNFNKEMGFANSAANLALGGLCLWQGFKKEKAAVKK